MFSLYMKKHSIKTSKKRLSEDPFRKISNQTNLTKPQYDDNIVMSLPKEPPTEKNVVYFHY